MLSLGLSITSLVLSRHGLAPANLISGALPLWLSHSRAGGAMMFDSTGKLTWAPENLLTYSNDFSNAAWTANNTTLTSGQLDTDGSNNAWLLTSSGGVAASHFLAVSSAGIISANINHIFSITAKANTAGYIHLLQTGANNWAQFSLSTGAMIYSGGSGLLGYGSEDLGNGWWRFFIKVNTSIDTSARVYVLESAQNTSGPSEITSVSMYVYKAQLERVTYQTSPRTYNPTTSAAYYGPRFDYDLATLTALGLLLEGTRTNVVLRNRDLTNAAWTKTNVTAAKDQTGVDGVTNSASKITATAGNGTILQAITLASSARFQSAYVKRVTGSGVVEMTTDNGTTWTAITVTADWARVSIPTQTLANPTVGFRIVTSGDAIAVDFVQNENGIFASSPIWTTTAAVTRASDVCQIIGAGLTAFNSNYGAAVVQFRVEGDETFNPRVISGSLSSTLGLFYGAGGIVHLWNGTNDLNSGVSALTTFKRFGCAWNKVAPSRRIQATGGSLTGDSNSPNIGVTTQWLGSVAGSGNFCFMHVQSLAFYNQNLTDAQLASKLTVDGPY